MGQFGGILGFLRGIFGDFWGGFWAFWGSFWGGFVGKLEKFWDVFGGIQGILGRNFWFLRGFCMEFLREVLGNFVGHFWILLGGFLANSGGFFGCYLDEYLQWIW